MKPIVIDQDIMDRVINSLQQITEGANYYTTFTTVEDNYPEPFTIEQLPAINVLDTSESNNNDIVDSSDYFHEGSLFLDLDLVLGNNKATYIRNAKADVLKCIGNNRTWDGKAFDTKYLGSERNPVDRNMNIVADVRIRIEIQFRTRAWRNNG